MKGLILLIFCIVMCLRLGAHDIKNALKNMLLNNHYYGIDVAQFNNYIGANKIGFNLGACYSYKPFHSLSFNSSLTYNSVHKGVSYSNLTQYNTKGVCLKLGTDVTYV